MVARPPTRRPIYVLPTLAVRLMRGSDRIRGDAHRRYVAHPRVIRRHSGRTGSTGSAQRARQYGYRKDASLNARLWQPPRPRLNLKRRRGPVQRRHMPPRCRYNQQLMASEIPRQRRDTHKRLSSGSAGRRRRMPLVLAGGRALNAARKENRYASACFCSMPR